MSGQQGHIVQRPQQAQIVQRSWFEAYKRFLFSNEESLGLKLSPLAIFGFMPVAVADLVIPVIGELIDIPAGLLAAVIIWKTWRRVRHYR